jgi:hypothetical protein
VLTQNFLGITLTKYGNDISNVVSLDSIEQIRRTVSHCLLCEVSAAAGSSLIIGVT